MRLFFGRKKKDSTESRRGSRSTKQIERDLRNHREAGQKAISKGKFEAAKDEYIALTRLEPNDPEWQRKLADCYRRLGRRVDELNALCRTATLYSETGYLLKAVAMCKMALVIDPEHVATQKKMAELHGKGQASPTALPLMPAPRPRSEKPNALGGGVASSDGSGEASSSALPVAEPLGTERARVAPSISPGAPLASVELGSLVGSSPLASDADSSQQDVGAVEILLDAEVLSEPPPTEEETEADRISAAIAAAIERTPLLSDLNNKTLMALIAKLRLVELEPGAVLFEQGDPADSMYVVVEGEVIASVSGLPPVELARLGGGEFFGEIGLLAEQPRQATITAASATQLLVFDRSILNELGASEPEFLKILLRFVRERLVASIVRTSPLFAPFGGAELDDLTRRFKFLEVQPESCMIAQGGPADGVFVLLTGAAKVVQEEGGDQRQLGKLVPGDVFGEMSLLNHEDAIAGVWTTEKCFVLELPANDFRQIIMIHPAVLAFVSGLAHEREQKNAGVSAGSGLFQDERVSFL
ncbi:MAG: cyclic nucleotide-binding domain-containing protein [Polyangiaceae bacterium]|nr:cyclic nucleotide-binding domain-containing protein [Polyangiaceae bacterium]